MTAQRPSILRFLPQLPLLRRELTELANRRRTYVIRIVGAVLLLSLVFIAFERVTTAASGRRMVSGMPLMSGPTQQPPGVSQFFGIGKEIFAALVPYLFRCIQLLMPALCCSTITAEKESNTLGTLFLTRLSPFAIILEKMGSRLIPMLTFLLLTFPVLAFVYSLGGVDVTLLLSTIWLLMCECLLYASIGMLCSSWFKTTVSAFMCAYVMVLVMLMFSAALGVLTPTPFDLWLRAFAEVESGFSRNFMTTIDGGFRFYGVNVFAMIAIVMLSLPSLMLSAMMLGLARFFLFRRAFVTGSSPILKVFRVLDSFFVRLNNRTTRGIELIKDSNSLPLFDPIAWRERTRKSLGKARYLFRILTALEIPTLCVCSIAATAGAAGGYDGVQIMLVMLWSLAALLVTVKASTAISSERSRETIEALLSTPMTAAEILKEKVAGMRRLLIVLAIPIVTTHFTIILLNVDLRSLGRPGGFTALQNVLTYFVLTTATTMVVMNVLTWLSLGVGMYFHSQTKSVLVAVVFNVVWIMVPVMFASMDQDSLRTLLTRQQLGPMQLIALIGLPGPIVNNELWFSIATSGGRLMNSYRDFGVSASAGFAVFLILVQCGVWLGGRCLVLYFASRLLNRNDDVGYVAPLPQELSTFEPQIAT